MDKTQWLYTIYVFFLFFYRTVDSVVHSDWSFESIVWNGKISITIFALSRRN